MEYRNTLPPQTMLRQYRIEKVIGQGGFGITYLAFDTELHRQVAIKECYPRDFVSRDGTAVYSATPGLEVDFQWALDKFKVEATTLAKFRHPGIVQVLQIIQDENNTAYMVLEFVEGRSLDAWLSNLNQSPSQQQLTSILLPILDALSVVHEQGITHRDIAPDNIFIRPGGEALLLDFGSARLSAVKVTQSLNLVVKDGYSAPEQYYAEGRQGPWTDIYALSATLYRCISGKKPVVSMARLDAVNNEEEDPLPPLSKLPGEGYSAGFLSAVEKGLAPQIKARPQSVADWRKQLFVEGDVTEQVVTGTAQPPGDLGRKKSERDVSRTTGRADRSSTKQIEPKRSNARLWAVLALLLIGSGGGALWYQQALQRWEEAKDWQSAFAQDTDSAYSAYLERYPTGANHQNALTHKAALDAAWDIILGDGQAGRAADVIANDDHITLAGYEDFGDVLGQQAVVYSLSHSGRILWKANFGDAGAERFYAITRIANGNLIAVGEATSNKLAKSDAIVVSLSPAGKILWSRRFGGPGSDRLNAVALTAAGGVVAVGAGSKNVNSGSYGWMVELSSAGELVRERSFEVAGSGEFNAVAATEGGGFVLGGRFVSDAGGPPNFWIMRLSSEGAILLDRQPGGAGVDIISSASLGLNGEVVLAGETTSSGKGSMDGVLLRLTADNKMPPKVISKPLEDRLYDVAVDGKGHIYAVGQSNSAADTKHEAWLVKYSSDLRDVLFEEFFSTDMAQGFNALALISDHALVTAGAMVNLSDGGERMIVRRVVMTGVGN